MQNLCDVDCLMALVHGRHEHHLGAARWIEGLQKEGDVGIARPTQVAVLRLSNNPAVMGVDVCTGREVWAAFDRMMKDSRMTIVAEPLGLEAILRRFTEKLKHSPKVWSDAYLAAFAIASGRTLVTFDRGFRAYPGLDVEVLG